ncbi:hypothetical protein, partial [Streptomyces sp. ME18-1-4]|uniref:hypothetical protein n=1 Tax=Streptomyces sp. ME18-1-4 TaxID=3028685 RepID=UPI0029BA1B30
VLRPPPVRERGPPPSGTRPEENPMPRPLSARTARTIIDAAELVKAPDWPETRHWHVTAGGEVLVVIAPSYGGASKSGRNGWRWWLAAIGPTAGQPEPTIQQAAARGLTTWQRWATSTAGT